MKLLKKGLLAILFVSAINNPAQAETSCANNPFYDENGVFKIQNNADLFAALETVYQDLFQASSRLNQKCTVTLPAIKEEITAFKNQRNADHTTIKNKFNELYAKKNSKCQEAADNRTAYQTKIENKEIQRDTAKEQQDATINTLTNNKINQEQSLNNLLVEYETLKNMNETTALNALNRITAIETLLPELITNQNCFADQANDVITKLQALQAENITKNNELETALDVCTQADPQNNDNGNSENSNGAAGN